MKKVEIVQEAQKILEHTHSVNEAGKILEHFEKTKSKKKKFGKKSFRIGDSKYNDSPKIARLIHERQKEDIGQHHSLPSGRSNE